MFGQTLGLRWARRVRIGPNVSVTFLHFHTSIFFMSIPRLVESSRRDCETCTVTVIEKWTKNTTFFLIASLQVSTRLQPMNFAGWTCHGVADGEGHGPRRRCFSAKPMPTACARSRKEISELSTMLISEKNLGSVCGLNQQTSQVVASHNIDQNSGLDPQTFLFNLQIIKRCIG
jgi:hypothetical protein